MKLDENKSVKYYTANYYTKRFIRVKKIVYGRSLLSERRKIRKDKKKTNKFGNRRDSKITAKCSFV